MQEVSTDINKPRYTYVRLDDNRLVVKIESVPFRIDKRNDGTDGLWHDVTPPVNYFDYVDENDVVHQRPPFALHFDPDAGKWVLDEEARLAAAKEAKIAEIDAKTQNLITAGFDFAGKRFSMSDAAQRNWTMLGTARANGMMQYPYPISSMDEVTHILQSDDELLGFLVAYAAYQADPLRPLGAGRTLKAQISECETVEAVEAVTDDRE